ncbi:MAG: hypothetical protein J2P36_15730, partial [Ktedonobacteraceae bacterium]|nr:hypothetical protein [Ktedonobacteraceae bacterium]
MNISTGGPQILLFERDQQLAVLLTSELQLAGYGCLTARTAVEVFDAMARQPIKLVLINLAQAAASRREFWVALDAQRRGRGIQVFSFHCINIASYGPRELEEFTTSVPSDMEVDGMTGIVDLVNAIQTLVPSPSSAALPRQNSGRLATQPSMPPLPPRDPAFTMPDEMASQPMPAVNPQSFSPRHGAFGQNQLDFPEAPPPAPSPQSTGSQQISSYSEKIRAVLYPNQRNWSAGGTFSAPSEPKAHEESVQGKSGGNVQKQYTTGAATSGSAPAWHVPAESPAAQRMVNSQGDLSNESSLDQLSRLVQERRSAMGYAPVPPSERSNSSIAEQLPMMRPAPIQDLPTARPAAGQEAGGYSEITARKSIDPTPASMRAPASIRSQPSVTQPLGGARSTPSTAKERPTLPLQERGQAGKGVTGSQKQQYTGKTIPGGQPAPTPIKDTAPNAEQQVRPGKEIRNGSAPESIRAKGEEQKVTETNPMDNNAVLMDILQSLPALPPQPKPTKSEQLPVLNGRATRTL